MSHIHINFVRGHYIGQLRKHGHRKWETCTGKCKSPEAAMSKAVKNMRGYKRARVLFIDATMWYGPSIVMECSR